MSAISVRAIIALPAAMAITRFCDGHNVLLLNPKVDAAQLLRLGRLLLREDELEALEEYLDH